MPASELQPATYAGKLAKVSPASVIQRYLNDEKTADIAESLGVKKSLLNYWLLATSEEEWKQAQVARAVTLRDEAEQNMIDLQMPTHKDDVPVAQVELAHARERLKSAQWQLERLLRRLYGQDQPAHVQQIIVQVGAQLRNNTEDAQVIDINATPTDSLSVGGEGVGGGVK